MNGRVMDELSRDVLNDTEYAIDSLMSIWEPVCLSSMTLYDMIDEILSSSNENNINETTQHVKQMWMQSILNSMNKK